MSATEQAAEAALDALGRLEGGRFHQTEIFAKSGRSRRVELEAGRKRTLYSQERGWAARAGERRGSFFFAAEGLPNPDAPFPSADGPALELPAPLAAPPWTEPEDLATALAGERESLALLGELQRALSEELPGARVLRAAMEDGASESWIFSSRGLRGHWRQRLASLYVEAAGPRRSGPSARLYLAQRQARHFAPQALARRLADLLLIAHRGEARRRDRGEMLLAPGLAAKILTTLLPLFVGPGARALAERLAGQRGQLTHPGVTLRDNGRLPGGALEAPMDGEGVPTRDVVLAEGGVLRQPLVAWHQLADSRQRPAGCSLRAGWREVPKVGPTHLYLAPSSVPVAELLGGIARGYYLLEASGPVRVDFERDELAVPVLGFEVRGGRANAPVAHTTLYGSVTAFLRNLQATARDLSFLPTRGMVGSPTVLVTGLELRSP